MSIDLEVDKDGVATVTINRPEVHNALDAEHYAAGVRAVWQARRAAPDSGDGKRRLLRDFDRSPELVEAKPLGKLCALLPRNVYDQRALVLGHEEIEQDLALRGEQPGMDCGARSDLVNIAGDQPL